MPIDILSGSRKLGWHNLPSSAAKRPWQQPFRLHLIAGCLEQEIRFEPHAVPSMVGLRREAMNRQFHESVSTPYRRATSGAVPYDVTWQPPQAQPAHEF